MSDHRSDMRTQVTLEDLLRLKRAERPPPEFWTEFERELRQKQLAALVEKKSWWHELATACGRSGRLRLPLGVTAVLALTFLSIRYYFQPGDDQRMNAGVNPAEQAVVAVTTMQPPDDARPVTAVPSASNHTSEAPPASSSSEKTATLAVQASRAAAPGQPGQVSDLIPWLGEVSLNRTSTSEPTPSARSIAVNLAAAAVIEPEFVDTAARPLGFEDRAMPAMHPRHTADVLPTATAVTEPRRARLLASLGSAGAYMPEPSAPERVRRSVTRYLTQDGWDRSIGRLAAEGDRLSIRF